MAKIIDLSILSAKITNIFHILKMIINRISYICLKKMQELHILWQILPQTFVKIKKYQSYILN